MNSIKVQKVWVKYFSILSNVCDVVLAFELQGDLDFGLYHNNLYTPFIRSGGYNYGKDV